MPKATFVYKSRIELGSFAFGSNLVVGDFNNDGKLDLAALSDRHHTLDGTDYPPSASILLGQGDGTLQDPQTIVLSREPMHMAAADFNGDRRLDLAVTYPGDDSIGVLPGRGDASLGEPAVLPVGAYPWSIVAGDFNHDGRADLATTNAGSDSVSVLLGHGDGLFRPVMPDLLPGSSPTLLEVADFNEDGILDMAVALGFFQPSSGSPDGSSVSVRVLLGRGDGSFQATPPLPIRERAGAIAAGDFNADGHQDLAISYLKEPTIDLLLGSGNGVFRLSSGAGLNDNTGLGLLAVGDFNGDGRADLAATNLRASAYREAIL